MSDALLNTQKKQLMLVYKQTETVTRPGGANFTTFTFPLQYTDTGYTPMIMGYYRGYNNDTYLTQETFSASYTRDFNLKYQVGIYAKDNQIEVATYGWSGDGTTYSFPVTFYVFVNSVQDE